MYVIFSWVVVTAVKLGGGGGGELGDWLSMGDFYGHDIGA